MDLLIITLLVVLWPVEEGGTRLDSQFFIFYYPIVLGFAFVMPRKIEATDAVAAVVAYALVMVLFGDLSTHPNEALSTAEAVQVNVKSLLFRLIVLGAMGGLGNYFWRIQRERRRAAVAGGSLG